MKNPLTKLALGLTILSKYDPAGLVESHGLTSPTTGCSIGQGYRARVSKQQAPFVDSQDAQILYALGWEYVGVTRVTKDGSTHEWRLNCYEEDAK